MRARASAGTHATSAGAMPETRYSSTSPTPSGTRTLMSAARLPGSIVPYSPPKPRARAPVRVALSSNRARRHRRGDAPRWPPAR